jgi:hypothetical protein
MQELQFLYHKKDLSELKAVRDFLRQPINNKGYSLIETPQKSLTIPANHGPIKEWNTALKSKYKTKKDS